MTNSRTIICTGTLLLFLKLHLYLALKGITSYQMQRTIELTECSICPVEIVVQKNY